MTLVVLTSRLRFVVRPIVRHVLTVETDHPDRTVAVLVPELVENR